MRRNFHFSWLMFELGFSMSCFYFLVSFRGLYLEFFGETCHIRFSGSLRSRSIKKFEISSRNEYSKIDRNVDEVEHVT